MAVDTFTTSDGVRLAYYLDDFTDPWRQADTLLMGLPHNICDAVPDRCAADVLAFLRRRFGLPA